MKRFFTLIIVSALLLLTACSQEETTAGLRTDEHIMGINTVTGTVQTESKRAEYISAITVENMLSDGRILALQRAGIRTEITSVTENEDKTLQINLQLKNSGGKILNLPVTAMLDFSTYGDGFHGPGLYWGSINIYGNELILTTLNHIYLIDTDKMTVKGTQFRTDGITPGDYYLGDTVKKGEEYIACYYDATEDGNKLIVFNSDGSLKQVIESDYYFFARYYGSDYMAYSVDIDTKTELFFIDKEQNLLAEKDESGGSYVYDLQSDCFLYYRTKVDEAVPGGRLSLITLEDIKTGAKTDSIATLYDAEDSVADSFYTQIELHRAYEEKYYLESKNLKTDVQQTAEKVYTIFHPYFAQQIVVDFNTQTSQTEYTYDSRWPYEVSETSPDGEYSIIIGSYHGGGDSSYMSNVLLEKATGKMKYIGETGGMYGGRSETGFLKNGDIYLFDYGIFDVYNRDMANPAPVWRLTDYFKFDERRYLMAARRDPEDMSVSIIYFDYPDVEDDRDAYVDYEKDGVRLKATYHFARVTKDGKVEFDYDTGVNVLKNFGLTRVSIYPEDDGNMHFYGWTNSQQHIWFEGSINPHTGRYTAIKEYKPGKS